VLNNLRDPTKVINLSIRPARCGAQDDIKMPPRRQNLGVLMIIAVSAFLGLTFVLTFRNQAEGTRYPDYASSYQEPIGTVDPSVLHGTASAPKLENATLKCIACPFDVSIKLTDPQSRTRQRSLESPTHNDGEIS
jgi:hypothetical protein